MATKTGRNTGMSFLIGTVLVLGICLFSAGCLSASPGADGDALNGTDTKPDRAPLLNGTEWILKSYDNGTAGMAPGIEGTDVTLKFDDDGRIAGSAGINNYFASYETEGETLSFGLIGSTLMAGSGPLMIQESTYLSLLGQTASFGINGDELTLFDSEGAVLLVFEKAQTPAPAPLTQTVWVLTAYDSGNGGISSVIAGTDVTLTFDGEGSISGSAGCNTYFASCETDGTALSFGPVGSTKMFCDEPVGTMEQESTYLNLLQSASGYEIEGDCLTMQDSSGKTILTFTAAD